MNEIKNDMHELKLTPAQETVFGTIGALIWLAWIALAVLSAFAPEKLDGICPWAGSTLRWPFVIGTAGCLAYGWLSVLEDVLGQKKSTGSGAGAQGKGSPEVASRRE